MAEDKPIVVIGALVANLAIAVSKFIAAALSRSSAMLAEAIHSLADTGNEVLLLVGLRRSRRPPDTRHPYGHGKEIYFWGLIVAMVLFGLGGGMSIYEGIAHLLRPHEPGSTTASYATLAAALVFESISLVIGLRELRQRWPDLPVWRALRASKDPSLYTVVAEDVAAIAGLIVAFAGVLLSDLTGNWALDATASIVVGAILMVDAFFLAAQSRTLLTGEAVEPRLVEDIRRLAGRDPAIRRVGDPLTMRLGPAEVLLTLDVEFHAELSSDEVRRATDRLSRTIQDAHPELTRIYIEPARIGPRRAALQPAS
jgi:cation diffusion facilitator family transporter